LRNQNGSPFEEISSTMRKERLKEKGGKQANPRKALIGGGPSDLKGGSVHNKKVTKIKVQTGKLDVSLHQPTKEKYARGSRQNASPANHSAKIGTGKNKKREKSTQRGYCGEKRAIKKSEKKRRQWTGDRQSREGRTLTEKGGKKILNHALVVCQQSCLGMRRSLQQWRTALKKKKPLRLHVKGKERGEQESPKTASSSGGATRGLTVVGTVEKKKN